ncbi:hypothetical protein Bbelb_363610 [Branchiostoma belcheri]|nr:hypothetical protein Bbelb_363610 [Branchiostoma belcheri]
MGSADVFSDKASSEMLRKDDVSLATPRRLFPACWERVPVSLFPGETRLMDLTLDRSQVQWGSIKPTGLRQFRHQAGINNRQPAWLHPITADKRSWTGKTEIVYPCSRSLYTAELMQGRPSNRPRLPAVRARGDTRGDTVSQSSLAADNGGVLTLPREFVEFLRGITWRRMSPQGGNVHTHTGSSQLSQVLPTDELY